MSGKINQEVKKHVNQELEEKTISLNVTFGGNDISFHAYNTNSENGEISKLDVYNAIRTAEFLFLQDLIEQYKDNKEALMENILQFNVMRRTGLVKACSAIIDDPDVLDMVAETYLNLTEEEKEEQPEIVVPEEKKEKTVVRKPRAKKTEKVEIIK